MTVDRKRLRELALAATPGPWEQQLDGWTVRVVQSDTEKERGWRICMTDRSGPNRVEQEVANSEYIAAANPQTILAILDALEAAEAENCDRDTPVVTQRMIDAGVAAYLRLDPAEDSWDRLVREIFEAMIGEAAQRSHPAHDALAERVDALHNALRELVACDEIVKHAQHETGEKVKAGRWARAWDAARRALAEGRE